MDVVQVPSRRGRRRDPARPALALIVDLLQEPAPRAEVAVHHAPQARPGREAVVAASRRLGRTTPPALLQPPALLDPRHPLGPPAPADGAGPAVLREGVVTRAVVPG